MYNRYAEDFYGEFYDQTTDDTDYAHRDGESSDERHSRAYVSRTHDIELLNAKFNPRPSRPAGNAKVRSQTIEKVYRSKKGRKGGFVKKLNNAVRLHTVDDESSMDYMYRDQTTRLGGTLDFTQRTSHRQALDSLTYNFTQERGLDSLTMGTIMLTEGSEPGDLDDRLRPLINSDVIGHSVSYIQAENEELKEHVKRLSYKLLKMEKNCGFASESMFSQNLGSTVVYHTRPHILQEEMDVVDQEYQAVMSEYNYLTNRLKQLRDPMYRKELEDKRLKVVEETNMIAKMLKNTMKRADIEEKELQAIREGKKYPEILKEVNLKQTEMMKIQKKLEVLRKKNREFEREKNIKEEREKELTEKFEGLQYMDDYYRGASLDRTQRKTRRSEEETVREKRVVSVNRGESTGYAKQIEDAKNKYMRQQLLSEIESLTLQNMQEKEHLSKLEEIAREQRQMIYSVMEREKITGFEWSKDIKEPQKQPKISKEFLTPPKTDVAEKKTFDLQVLEEEELDEREDEYSDDWAMNSQSSGSNGKAAKSSIRIRKMNVPSPKKEKEKTAVKKDEVHDEVVIVKEDKESKAVMKMSPRLKENTPVEIVSKKVETVEKGTSPVNSQKSKETVEKGTSPVNSQKSKESPQKGRVLEESSLSIQCLSDLQEEKEYSMESVSQKESPRTEKNKQDNKEKVEPVELKLIEKEGGQHEIAQVVSLGESMAMVEEAIQPKEKVVMKEEIVKKVVVPLVEIARKEEVIQPKEEAVKENAPVVEQDIKEEVLEEQVAVPPVSEEKIFETVEIKAEPVEVTAAEIMPETVKVLKPVLSRRSTNRQLRMPSIPELLKENSTEKDPTPQKSEPIEVVNPFETKEDTPKSDIPVISEASVHEEEPEKVMETQTEQDDLEEDKPKEDEKVVETQTAQECLEEEKSEEPKELVLPECVLKTRKSLFKKNDEVEEEVQKEKEPVEVQAEGKVEAEVEGSSTTKPVGKSVVKFGQVGLMGRMNTIRRPNITEATPKNSDKKKEEVKPAAKVATKQFVMPARKLVISKGVGTTKRNMAVGKQEGIVAVKGTSEARSEPFTEMSSSEYFVSEAGSGLLPESIVVMRTEKVSIAVGTDDVYAGTGKLVENLMLGKEKDVRELALDFERKLREKTMTMTMQKEVKKEDVMVEKGTEAMLYGC